jgi:hypothetical protein
MLLSYTKRLQWLKLITGLQAILTTATVLVKRRSRFDWQLPLVARLLLFTLKALYIK